MTIGRTPDKLFGDSGHPLLITGDYVILARDGGDDYVRPADMRSDCDVLNTPAVEADDFSEPNRFVFEGVVIDNGRWRLDANGFVRTNYNCYPTGGDFYSRATLEIANIVDTTSASPSPPYMIDGIAFTYGCCYGVGIGYARWGSDSYRRVEFAYTPNQLHVQPYNADVYDAVIYRQDGALYVGAIEVGVYTLPEPMSVRRLSLEVRS